MSYNIKGFHIVVTQLKDAFGEAYTRIHNKNYLGIDRRPHYHLANHFPRPYYYEAEVEAMDVYTFGDYFDEEKDIIVSLEKAKELLKLFRKSPREFEIIYIESVDDDKNNYLPSQRENEEFLGYDVAQAGFPYSTYLINLGSDSCIEMEEYFNKLNKYGLFQKHKDARDFWIKYKQLKLYGWDDQVTIFKIYKVIYNKS